MEKCTFSCKAKRTHKTDDASEDYQFNKGGGVNILAAYTVYVGAQVLVEGWQHWDGFVVPLGAATYSVGAVSALAVAAMALF